MAYVTVAGNTIKANPNAKPGSITGTPVSSGGSSGGSSREYDPSAPNIYLSQTPTTGGVRGPTTKTNYSGNIATTLSAESLGSQSTSVASIPQYPGGVTGVTGTKPGAFNEFSSAFTTPQGYTTDANGNVVPEQQTEQTDIGSLFEKYFPQKESVLQNKQVQQAQDQYDEARNRQRGFSNQIAQITNTAQAKALSTIGQGRGIPEAIIGGQQSQIYREAAIQALPIQSQLAFAQGDVEAAQEHLARLTAVLTEEVNNRYEFQKSLGMAVINYATDVQKMQISSLLDEKKAFSTAQAETYQMLSLNGAPPSVWESVRGAKNTQQLYQAAGKYGTDIQGAALRQAQIDATNRSNQGDGAPKVVSVNGVDSVWNSGTGQFEAIASPAQTKAQLQNNEALTLAKELRADDAVGKKSAVGASLAKSIPFAQAAGLQGKRTAYEAKVTTLKANLTLENLKLLKGAMSDKDLLFLNAIGSSLDTNMEESTFNKELDRVIGKLETAGATTAPKEGDVKVWEGVSYVVRDGQWVPK